MSSFVDSLRRQPAYPLEHVVDNCEQAIKFECGRLRMYGHASGVVSDYDNVQSLSPLVSVCTTDEQERKLRKAIEKPVLAIKQHYYMDDKGGRYRVAYPLAIPAEHINAVMEQLHQRVQALGFTRYTLTPMQMRQVHRLIEPASFLKPIKVTDQVQPYSSYMIFAELYW